MALQGTLETFSVPEVLRLLAGTRKTGMLSLEGDRGAGQVWLQEGRIAGARSQFEPEGEIESVLFDLLRYEDGSFIFETDAAYPGDVPADADVETALAAAEALLEEWAEIAAVVPSLRVWVSMVPTIAGDSVTVTAEQWAALAIVGRGTSAQRLADELGLGELDGSRRVRDLVDAGLVEVDDTPVEPPAVEPFGGAVTIEPDDLGEAGTWTTTDDLTVGLAGFVARAADEERSERTPLAEVSSTEADEPHGVGDASDDDTFAEGGFADDAFTDDAFADDAFAEGTPADDAADDEPDHELDLEAIGEADEHPVLGPVAPLDADPEPVDAPAAEVEETLAGDAAPAPAVAAADSDPDEFLSQLANLSPKAAAAIEATASAEEAPVRRLPSGDGDEEINRNLLLKFLSSAKQ